MTNPRLITEVSVSLIEVDGKIRNQRKSYKQHQFILAYVYLTHFNSLTMLLVTGNQSQFHCLLMCYLDPNVSNFIVFEKTDI